jgi:hypothetical protein
MGIAYVVPLKVGEWSGKVNLLIVPLDDFEIILGNEFFVLAKVIPMPFLGGMLIIDESQPCFVKVVRKELPPPFKGSKDGVLSAMQLKHGLRRGEITYLATLREVKEETYVDVPKPVLDLLEKFGDVMPLKLPRALPSKHVVDHIIELLPSSTPPAQTPDQMSPKELVELQK